MQPVIRELASPQVMAVMRDFVTLQRWEVLRRSDEALSAAQFATACGTTERTAQASLDLLVDAGFVKKLRARRGQPAITYEAEKALVVEWSPSDPQQLAFSRESRKTVRQVGRAILDRSATPASAASGASPAIESIGSPSLTVEEAMEIVDLLRNAVARFADFERRQAGRSMLQRRRGATSSEAAPQRIPYLFNVLLTPVLRSELPIPGISLGVKKDGRNAAVDLYQSPLGKLSSREAEIARLLARGASRPAVATALGLSPASVASMTKRIYSKLGVHSRAEFAARMSQAARP